MTPAHSHALSLANGALIKALIVLMRPIEGTAPDQETLDARMACLRAQDAIARLGGLSGAMRDAVAIAAQHGGRLTCHPGGCWTGPTRHDPARPGTLLPWVGARTVHALVSRGLLRYTAWREDKRGRFPVEATVIP